MMSFLNSIRLVSKSGYSFPPLQCLFSARFYIVAPNTFGLAPDRGRQFKDRMDGHDVESCTRLYEDQPWLHELLRGNLRRAFPRRAGPPLRAGLRPSVYSGKAPRAISVAIIEDGFRELDERSFSRRRPG